MSDMQDLIHTNAHNAFGIGLKTERERIIKLVNDCKIINTDQKYFLLALIKEEQK
jgi:hypothetical protein